MKRAQLTPERVQRYSKKPGMYHDGGGLYLRVTAKPDGEMRAAASWVFRYMLGGKAREMGLGSYPEVPLQSPPKRKATPEEPNPPDPPPGARELAAQWRAVKARGEDPIAIREAQRAAERLSRANIKTFKECAQDYIADHRAGWKNAKHDYQWRQSLETFAYPVLGDVPVAEVDTPLVVRVLSPIWISKAETASRLRARIERILDWAKVRGYRQGENPARWRGHLETQLPKLPAKTKRVQHLPALPYSEVSAFMSELRGREGTSARALEFLILTVCRTSEVLGARWDEIDLDAKTWTVPAARIKMGKDHRVPLSKPALAILAAQRKLTNGRGFAFPGTRNGKPLSNMTMLMQLRRMGRDTITAHGFRSSFRTWASEQTDFPSEVCEQALAHQIPDAVVRAYKRTDLFDRRVSLMDAWARHCTAPAEGSAKVIPIKRKPTEAA